MSITPEDSLITWEEHASALRQIAKDSAIWPEAKEELNVIAEKLDAMPDLLKFLETLANMKTEEEFGEDQPEVEDYAWTLSEIIMQARAALAKVKGAAS